MIKNERQYRLTKMQAQKFERALAQMQNQMSPTDMPLILHKVQQDALHGQLADLQREIDEYEALRDGLLRN